jgi:hypothetical protein
MRVPIERDPQARIPQLLQVVMAWSLAIPKILIAHGVIFVIGLLFIARNP